MAGGLTPGEPTIRCHDLTKVFGPAPAIEQALAMARDGSTRSDIQERTGATLAVHDVSFSVDRGELFVVMGLSGSGKSTLVRLLNRLIEPSSGSVEVDGRELGALDDAALRTLRNQHMSMVFQHFALLPHRTVLQNAAYALQVRGVPEPQRRERAKWALEQVGLGDRGDALPDQLSGGMKQRVGLARALASDTDVLLMDEPFSALDPLIRRDMQALLIRLQKELHKTIVFITHDLNEAMRVGDRILLLKDGKLAQLGTGPEILAAPADDYVADFVSDVDRTRVLTAEDVLREALLVVQVDDRPADALRRMGASEFTDAYVVDADRRILGVVHDKWLADAARRGSEQVGSEGLRDDFVTVERDRPLIEFIGQLGKHAVPMAVVDDQRRLLGVVPRAAVLASLSAVPGRT